MPKLKRNNSTRPVRRSFPIYLRCAVFVAVSEIALGITHPSIATAVALGLGVGATTAEVMRRLTRGTSPD